MNLQALKIAALGHGNMQQGIMNQLFNKNIVLKSNYTGIVGRKISQEKLLEKGINSTLDHSVIRNFDIIFLSYKQKNFWEEPVYENMSGKMIISIIAGIKAGDIQKKFKGADIIQAMPNRGSVVGEGCTFLFFPGKISSEKKDIARALFQESGKVYEVSSLEEMNLGIVCSASLFGVIAFLRSLENSQEFLELFQEVALEMTRKYKFLPNHDTEMIEQTFAGVEEMAKEFSFSEIQESVTSPQGITHAMIEDLKENNIELFLEKRKTPSRLASRVVNSRDRLGIKENKSLVSTHDIFSSKFLGFLESACAAGLKRAQELAQSNQDRS